MINKREKVAIITGANSGVGYGIVQRLLSNVQTGRYPRTHLILACRSEERATTAIQKLSKEFPGLSETMEFIPLDVGCRISVNKFCKEVKKRFDTINLLFLNAGILPVEGPNYSGILKNLFSPLKFFTSATCMQQPVGLRNKDGVGTVFATNVLGHYNLALELEEELNNSGDGRIIWTSSIACAKDYFNENDIQHLLGYHPYESSKHAVDLTSYMLNKKYIESERSIVSFSTSPGVLASNIVLPWWIQIFQTLAQYLIRLFGVTSMTITGWNSAISNVFVATHSDSHTLDWKNKYHSEVTSFGTPMVSIYPCFTGLSEDEIDTMGTNFMEKMTEILHSWTL